MTDGAKERVANLEQAYTNVFIPTICGKCQKRTAPPLVSIGGFDNENNLPHNLRIKLDDGFVRDWRIFKLVVDYCKDDIRLVASQILDRKRIMKELGDYTAQIRSVRIVATPDVEGEMLETLPFFDIGFLE